MLRWIAFIAVSTGIGYISRKSLFKPRSHGFFRFFAVEFIFLLILINAEHWFHTPFSTIQIASWSLLVLSLLVAWHGFCLLHTSGRARDGIENTTILVRRGAYRYVRHPLYSSLILFGWGVFLKNATLLSTFLALVASVFLIATARAEEAENVQKFGDDYVAYMKKTKMFIPSII
jgi:protein-S-isoprenylcysteine O-methyltransferase Ste14